MNKQRTLQNIGLAMRAKALITGEEFSLVEIKKKAAYLVFLASDAGVNTAKRITDKCLFYEVPLITDFTSDELNKAIGKENRKVLAITSQKFAKLLKESLNEIL